MPRSTYYSLLKPKTDKYADVKVKLKKIYLESNKTKGYRWITHDLRAADFKINHKTVLKLMHELGIKSVVRRKKYSSYRPEYIGQTEENILKRDFSTTGLNEKWSTDVTEFKVCGQKVFLSGIMDLYNKELIAYSIYKSPKLDMVMDMVKQAYEKRPSADNVIIHSDQGWHYKHGRYKSFLKSHNAIQSMSRKGNCLDNAIIENFWSTLKSEWFYQNNFSSVDSFISGLKNYIYYYNNIRESPVLGYCTPVDFAVKNN